MMEENKIENFLEQSIKILRPIYKTPMRTGDAFEKIKAK